MKTILTLLFCVGTLSSVFAQRDQDRNYQGPRYEDQNRYESRNNNGRRYDDAYKLSFRERDELVSRINRDYNNRIESVRRRWFMNNFDKRRLISSLESERSAKISAVYARFSDGRNRYYDGYSYNNNDRRH